MHGGGQQELEILLDFGRLGVEEGSEGLEFRGKLLVVFLVVGAVTSECSRQFRSSLIPVG
jgi:hypothetical protein